MMFHKEWARSCMRCHGRKQESLNGRPGFLVHVIGRGIDEVKCIWGFPGHIDGINARGVAGSPSGNCLWHM